MLVVLRQVRLGWRSWPGPFHRSELPRSIARVQIRFGLFFWVSFWSRRLPFCRQFSLRLLFGNVNLRSGWGKDATDTAGAQFIPPPCAAVVAERVIIGAATDRAARAQGGRSDQKCQGQQAAHESPSFEAQ